MMTAESRPPVSPGEPAPNFTLPAVERPETVSLADYRGRSPVFLALFVGLWCPFCRRSIAQMGKAEGKLKALGVESLGIVATPPENARLYFKFRPTPFRLASDPELLLIKEAAVALSKQDGYTENATDKGDLERQWPQLKGQFLIDRDGIVRWANIECAAEGLA